MNEHVDEEIGALLDGRLDERRRSELLARLATADEDYDVFADTASVLQEAEGEGLQEVPASDRQEEAPRSAPVIPLRPRRATGWRSPAVRALAAAAVLGSVVLIPVVRGGMNGGGWQDPERLAVLATQSGARIPTEWTHGWSTTRGAGGTVEISRAAARVGALHIDLVVTARAADPVDTATVAQLATEAAATLEGVDDTGSSLAAAKYRAIADSAFVSQSRVLRQLSDARDDVDDAVDSDYFAAGAWTEAARLAALRQDTAFFNMPESRKAVEHALGLQGLSGGAKEAANRVRAVEDQGKIQDWESLKQNLYDLQRGISR